MAQKKITVGKEIISIIVPVYNVDPYLSQCMESLINQTYKNIEIILVDDGSTDRCFDICEEYRKRDLRVKVAHTKNMGAVRARKTGFCLARGEYIAFVDGDDWVEPEMYERMYRNITEHHVDVVMCGRFEDTGKTRKEVFHGIAEGRYGKQEMRELVYPKMISGPTFFEWGIFPGLWDKLFRRECVEHFHFAVDDRIAMGDDAACTYPCLLNVDSIYVMRECLYHYRQNTASMVKKIEDSETERERFRILYQSVNQSLEKYANIFDLREQWKNYVLFLMVPRADALLEGMDDLDYLFPFPQVKRGSDIVLYGMGTYGQRLYRYIKKTGFCNIVMAADRNYGELKKQGIPAESPENIGKYRYDAIVVANSFASARSSIYSDLIRKYPPEKVQVMDEALIKSEEIGRRFGLI